MRKEMIGRLRSKADVYVKKENKTEFGEITYSYEKKAAVWAEIKPISGKENNIGGESVQAAITHKIVVRKKAIKEPRNDMYFTFKGQRYEVLYFLPNYRHNDLIEFYCKVIIETEEDYKND